MAFAGLMETKTVYKRESETLNALLCETRRECAAVGILVLHLGGISQAIARPLVT